MSDDKIHISHIGKHDKDEKRPCLFCWMDHALTAYINIFGPDNEGPSDGEVVGVMLYLLATVIANTSEGCHEANIAKAKEKLPELVKTIHASLAKEEIARAMAEKEAAGKAH